MNNTPRPSSFSSAAPTTKAVGDSGSGQAKPDAADARNNSKPLAPRSPDAAEDVKEIGGPKGAEPTRFGDWEQNGRCTDF